MPHRILLVEDDDGWRQLITRWLEARGCAVSSCARAADALPLARRVKPELAILDYELGDAKGTAVCAALRAEPGLERVPIVILTTLAERMLEISREAPLDHFVAKTPNPDELFAVLAGLLPGFSSELSG